MKRESNLVDHLTLVFFGLFSGRLGKRRSEEQYKKNREAWEAYAKGQRGQMLEHQSRLSVFMYGRTARIWEKLFLNGEPLTAAVNSCEVIAVYNALCVLEAEETVRIRSGAKEDAGSERGTAGSAGRPDFPALLAYFSGNGICANGLFGTAPGALERFFRQRGYRVDRFVGRQITRERMDAKAREVRVCILTAFNRGQDPFSMVHTMCVTKEKSGWQLHNDGAGSKIYPSLYDAVTGYNGGRSHPIQVLAIGTE